MISHGRVDAEIWRPLFMAESLSITDPADFHVHLRQGALSELVTPHVRKGGFSTAYVMV